MLFRLFLLLRLNISLCGNNLKSDSTMKQTGCVAAKSNHVTNVGGHQFMTSTKNLTF
jgi:hypothetical protein